MKRDELKPCPLCGGKVDFNYNIELEPDGIFCRQCRTLTRFMGKPALKRHEPFGVAMDWIKERWNRRA